MPKITQTPGAALKALLKKHHLNCNRLAKAIGMSNAIVRLMSLDESPISVSAAFRLAKFFKTKPEFWLSLQMEYSLAAAARDKALVKELNGIPDVGNYTFERKPRKTKSGKTPKKAKASKAKPAKKPKARNVKTAKPAGKRGRPSSTAKTGRKPKTAATRQKKTAKSRPAQVTRSEPASASASSSFEPRV
jgi:addiction module HigA family antidote